MAFKGCFESIILCVRKWGWGLAAWEDVAGKSCGVLGAVEGDILEPLGIGESWTGVMWETSRGKGRNDGSLHHQGLQQLSSPTGLEPSGFLATGASDELLAWIEKVALFVLA
ncbi:hypothetical protein RRG08_037621 [Elysia crispata]|uniref:Uncharacterized protein n=1 Tax=Elysia crispata TaxID=231223 RepID=A0AAE0YIC6_9GAST|nr:hypothetical protein RRG08_037621 [Elysia crispata]